MDINRILIIFKDIFTPEEIQILRDIYIIRNCFVHSYKTDNKIDFNSEDIIKKMGTIWDKISLMAILLFGKEIIKNNKPKKKYTEEELEQVLENEVRKMIQPSLNPLVGVTTFREAMTLGVYPTTSTSYLSSYEGEKCPRCGSMSFSFDGYRNDWQIIYSDLQKEIKSNLYKCKKCNLELTEKQYEIAKKIKKEQC